MLFRVQFLANEVLMAEYIEANLYLVKDDYLCSITEIS